MVNDDVGFNEMGGPDEGASRKLETELRSLLIAMVLNDATESQVKRLDTILLADVEMRRYAARFMEEEVLLQRQFEFLGRVVDLHNPYGAGVQKEMFSDTAQHAPPVSDASLDEKSLQINDLSTPLNSRQGPGRLQAQRYWTWSYAALAIATTVLATIVFTDVLESRRSRNNSPDVAISPGYQQLKDLGDPLSDDLELVHPGTTYLLHRVTHASWQGPTESLFNGSQEPSSGETPPSKIRQGLTHIAEFNGQPAGGYMVAIPPGDMLELIVNADSISENVIAIIDFGSGGIPTGEMTSFNNHLTTKNEQYGLRLGRLGTWSHLNDSSETQYFLLTAMHRGVVEIPTPTNGSGEKLWCVSDLKVFANTNNLLYIGWDDSGWVPAGANDQESVNDDDDFDDISVTAQFHRDGKIVQAPDDEIQTSPSLDDQEFFTGSEDSTYHFEVIPGNTVLLKISSSEEEQNRVEIIERSTGRIWWSRKNFQPDAGFLGTFIIENNSAKTREFLIRGQRNTSDDENHPKWGLLNYTFRLESETYKTIAFEHEPVPGQEWDDIRVDIQWVP